MTIGSTGIFESLVFVTTCVTKPEEVNTDIAIGMLSFIFGSSTRHFRRTTASQFNSNQSLMPRPKKQEVS